MPAFLDDLEALLAENESLKTQLVKRMQDNAELAKQIHDLTVTYLTRGQP